MVVDRLSNTTQNELINIVTIYWEPVLVLLWRQKLGLVALVSVPLGGNVRADIIPIIRWKD